MGAALGSDAAHFYMFVRGRDQFIRFHGIGGVDEGPAAETLWAGAEGLSALLSDADPDHVAPINELGYPPEDLYGTPTWRFAFANLGFNRAMHMNVTEGVDVRGHVSFVRRSPDPWKVSDNVRATAAATVRAAFREAWTEEVALAPPEGSASLAADGRITADPAVADWIARYDAGDWLRRRVRPTPSEFLGMRTSDRVWMPGSFAQQHAVPGGGTLFVFEPVVAMELPPVLFKLTPTQRRIASLAAAGATAVEIARELDRSPDTVREHLTHVYERLGIASRSELANVCRRMMM